MRFITATIALFASVALAQSSNNAISGVPSVTGGEQTTLEWTNPTGGQVDIWIQPVGADGLNIQADDGFVVASGVDAADLSAQFVVPADEVAPGVQYTFRIVDTANPTIYNFSPGFTVAGATGENVASASGSASETETDSASRTETDTASETETDSASTTETDSETTTATSTTSRTSTSRSTSATSSATNAPDSNNGVDSLKVQGGFIAAMAAAVAML